VEVLFAYLQTTVCRKVIRARKFFRRICHKVLQQPAGIPVLLLSCLEFPTFLGAANELGLVQPGSGFLDLIQRCWFADLINEAGGDIGFGAWEVTNELQEADYLGNT